MTKRVLTNYDFADNEVQNSRLHNLAVAPVTPGLGRLHFNTTDSAAYYWNGTENVSMDARKRTGIPIANLAVNPLARSNHTGQQTSSTISDLATTVKAYRLDEFTAPTTAMSWGGQRHTNASDPVAASDLATMSWVQSQVQSGAAGIDSKASVRALAVANIALSGLQTIDGVSLAVNDRVLLTGQTTAAQNGSYVVASGAWSRATDGDQNGEITPGAFWFVEEGTTYGKSQWRCSNSGSIVLGTTAITINQFNATADIVDGAGLSRTGNTFNVGAGTGISVLADSVAIDTSVVVRKAAATIGDGAATSYAITHNLGNQDVITQIRDVSTNAVVEGDIVNTSVNVVTVSFTQAPALNSLRVSIHG